MSYDSLINNQSISPASSRWPSDEILGEPGYLEYQEELRCLIFNTAQTVAPTREGSPSFALDPWIDVTPEKEQEVQHQLAAIMSTGRRLEYLKNWTAEVAPWLDMFDTKGDFMIQLPNIANRCPALLYAMLALSARQLERKEKTRHGFDSLELYQHAIQLLPPLLQAKDFALIPTCVILCVLEMMSASPRDWRRHLEGCAALFDAFGVNGFTGGILQSVFWCFARMDLCGALISDGTQSTLVPMAEWLPPGSDPDDAAAIFHGQASPNMHANFSVFLCSRVCELIADRTKFVELGEANGCDEGAFSERWTKLWHQLDDWLKNRPADMHPTQIVHSEPFPQILFADWAAISATQLYHTACILLLGAVPGNVTPHAGHAGSTIWHAKSICGISLTNPHPGCLNNAIQPLWVAARLLSHESEHVLVAKLIRSIESMTGWAAEWRLFDLELEWGHKVPAT
ncbi:fungal specific transcription factor domain-containing protein [Sarocladium implicatum]|nr:fungal specific transcription factor domain-containing protein [Sarocladium implicatum]